VAHDSQAPLRQCTARVEAVADTVVVIDAKPDQTVASARNEALDQATGDWVLMLDGTQTLDPGSVDIVRDLVEQGGFVGYTARQCHQFGFDGATSSIEERVAVLFPRDRRLRYVGAAGEQLLPQRDDVEFPLRSSLVVVHQHDYRRDDYDPLVRARRDLATLERSARDEPEQPFHLYNLGTALDRLGLRAEAEHLLREAIAVSSPTVSWRAAAHIALAENVAAQGRRLEAATLCKTAVKLAPDWAEGWCLLGGARLDAGRVKGAEKAFQRALSCSGPDGLAPGQPLDVEWRARAGLARIRLARGDYDEALDWLGPAIATNPGSAELRMLYAQGCEAVGRSAEARRHLDIAMASPNAGPEAFAAFGDFFARKAEDALLRGLADNPESRLLSERIERLRAARTTG
jgi:tetratricopeptide (TPR) repeat protein